MNPSKLAPLIVGAITLLAACGGGAAPASSAAASKPAASTASIAASASAKPAASTSSTAAASGKPVASSAAASAAAKPSGAVKTMKVAVPQADSLTTGGIYAVTDAKGFFKDEGLAIQPTFTSGGATTVQAVVSGSVDMAIGTGISSIMTAFTKNAPVQIVASDAIGVSDIYWFAKGDSPISKLEDLSGKRVGFTSRGSSTNLADEVINEMLTSKGLKPANLMPIGQFPDQLTAVKTGQIDVGVAAPPALLQNIANKEIKYVVRGADIPSLAGETLRGQFVNTNFASQHPDEVSAFIRAFNKGWKYMVANKQEAATIWKEKGKLQDPVNLLASAFDFYPEQNYLAQPLKGVDLINKQAVQFKAIDKPLTQDQLAKLITDKYLK